jgi:hypothetical protein
VALFHQGIAVADAAGFDFEADLVAGGLGNGALYEFEIVSRLGYLDCLYSASSNANLLGSASDEAEGGKDSTAAFRKVTLRRNPTLAHIRCKGGQPG